MEGLHTPTSVLYASMSGLRPRRRGGWLCAKRTVSQYREAIMSRSTQPFRAPSRRIQSQIVFHSSLWHPFLTTDVTDDGDKRANVQLRKIIKKIGSDSTFQSVFEMLKSHDCRLVIRTRSNLAFPASRRPRLNLKDIWGPKVVDGSDKSSLDRVRSKPNSSPARDS